MARQRVAVSVLFLLPLIAGCGNPPAATPPSPVAAPPSVPPPPAAPALPAPAVAATPPAVVMPAARPEPPPTVEDKNAADLAGLKAVLERSAQGAARAAVDPAEPRRPDASAPAEAPSERDLAAARESLPGLQDRLQQVIPRNFDAETFRRLLTTHPEFRKD